MTLSKKYIIILFGVLLIANSNKAIAQCFNTPWAFVDAPYSVGETVSNDGKDYTCKNAGYGHYEPSGSYGFNGWDLLSNPCAPIGYPVLDQVSIAGLYCRSAFGNGNVTANGGATILARGIVLSTSSGPTLADQVIINDYSITGPYSNLLSDLLPSTTYYAKAYATNSVGTGYSSTETMFTTDADIDCANCILACDKSDPTLLNPSTWPGIIELTDTICITNDITMSDNVVVRGTVKICNDAQVTLSGSITMQGANSGFGGQIIYEGCNEKFIGTGSYTGFRTADNSANDGDQMLSYCGTCNNSDRSQFFSVALVDVWWGAECRPESQVLPVQLSAFSAKKQSDGAYISWTTSSEVNNNYFEVQTSIDGVNWITIAIVQGAGNSSVENNYSFYDNEHTNPIQYYRLKNVDYDGTSHTSNIKTISFNTTSHSNPIIAFINESNEIEVKLGLNGLGTVYLVDARGRFAGQQSFISVNKKGTTLKFNKSKLSEGIYFVNLISNNQRFSQKVSVIN